MDEPRYQIGERSFRLSDLKIGQTRWIMQIVKGYSIFDLTPQRLMELFSDHLATMLAIVLVEEGMTQPEKIRAGMEGVRALAAWFDEHMEPEVCAEVLRDFLESGRLQKALMLLDVTRLTKPTTLSGSTT